MAQYLAVLRKIGELQPRKLTFEAADRTASALNEMERRTGVKVNDLVEYELMKIVDSGKGYIPVAARRAPHGQPRLAVVIGDEDVENIPASNVSKPQVNSDEKEYSPYTSEAA